MAPTLYSVRWTSKLIYRDIRAIATKCTIKVRYLFPHSTNATVPSSHDSVKDDFPIDTRNLNSLVPVRYELPSPSTAPDSCSTAPTETNEVSLELPTTFYTGFDTGLSEATEASELGHEVPTTLYALLSTNLKQCYAARERNLPPKERWMFRGAWLLLHMATQYCASSPSHNIFRSSSSQVNETALLLELLQYSVSGRLDSPTSNDSLMSAMPCMKRNDEPSRHDSVFSTTSARPSPPVTPALLWYLIFAGALDRTKTVHAAEHLIEHIWPERTASEVLVRVGNPAKQLPEYEEVELRRRLGHTLCAEFNVHP